MTYKQKKTNRDAKKKTERETEDIKPFFDEPDLRALAAARCIIDFIFFRGLTRQKQIIVRRKDHFTDLDLCGLYFDISPFYS